MRRILEKLSKGLISIEEAEFSLKTLTISEVENMAKLDIKREIRTINQKNTFYKII